MARSETPRPQASRDRWFPIAARIALGGGILLLGVAIALLVASRLGGERPTTTTQVTGKSITYDLATPLSEVHWIGHQPSPPAFFRPDRRMLEMRPDLFQLIELDQYDGTPGTFTTTISQATWRGDAGLYFGCRPEPKLNRPELTTFQLFVLQYFPAEGDWDEKFHLLRQRAMIGFSPTELRGEAAVAEAFPAPTGSQLRLEITFDKAGCQRVRVNDDTLGELSTAARNAQYLTEDYRGAFGLYCTAGGTGAAGGNRPGPTWFGNVVFTPAEK